MTAWRATLAVSAALAVVALAACRAEDVITSGNTNAQSEASSTIVGVATVTDGDTIEIHGTAIRLSGFDAPERGRMCGSTNVYQRASLALSDAIGSRTVHCAPDGTETHGRTVATCTVDGVDLGEQMVSQGWARDWPRFSHGVYADEEASARSGQRGIWGLQCPSELWGNRDYTTP